MVLFVYLSAVVPRVVFILHTVLAVWRVTLVKNDPIYWLLLLLILLTLVEMIVTLTVRKGKDYRGFSPALFFYLINIIPPVWMLELYQLEECNSKNSSTKCTNFIPSTEAPATKGHGNSSSTINVVIDFLNSTLDWTLGFHQTLMILLIVGKWILPMGVGISRDQLSQLLLTFVGIAADILEFKSETLSEKGVSASETRRITSAGGQAKKERTIAQIQRGPLEYYHKYIDTRRTLLHLSIVLDVPPRDCSPDAGVLHNQECSCTDPADLSVGLDIFRNAAIE
ncbi:transmembrane protein 26-like isoform X2 [Stegostoma tigrinum]|uniref:transmembrane protein 26-like isoform X2 n=1 Tax=Stegostoma tigrinum TaxID=3053191 RepID=UPI00202B674A|nr:transmembrane protein 26-like isoform X2 [Stegostoma tigrinum]